MAMLRRPECEPVTVWFSRTGLISSDHRPFISALTTSSTDTTTPPLPAWNAFPYPLKTTLSFPLDLSCSPYTIGSLNDPGPIKTVVQPAHYAPSRHASYGSASLRRQDTESLAHMVLLNSAPPRFCFYARCRVDNSLQQPGARVQVWVLVIFPAVTTFRLCFF